MIKVSTFMPAVPKARMEAFFDELEKIAFSVQQKKPEDSESDFMRTAVNARPWVAAVVKGALPAASLASFLPVVPKAPPNADAATALRAQIAAQRKRAWLVGAAAALGAGVGLADKYMKMWAAKHPRHEVTRKLEEQFSQEKGVFTKSGAMAADMRRRGLGGVKEPPFPTEDSKQYAERQLHTAQKPAKFTTHTQRKHIEHPGPSIRQVAPIPR